MNWRTPLQLSHLIFSEDNRFEFSYSLLSSYWPAGTYSTEKGKVMLSTDDGNYTYVFKIEDNHLIFDESQSSEMQIFEGEPVIHDGAVFVYQGTE